MSSSPRPWADQPAGTQPAPGWTQPGQPSGPAGYDPVPGGYPGPVPAYAPGGPAYEPVPGYSAPPGYGAGHPPVPRTMPLRTDYAGWGKRAGAYLIDFAPSLIGYLIFLGGYVYWLVQLSLTTSTSTPDLTVGLTPMVIGLAIMLVAIGWILYNRWVTGGRTGQSLGKRVMKIQLISEQTDAPIGAMNAFVRDLVHLLDGMAYVGYLWPLWDDKRQTFADKIVRTIVVNAS